MVALLNYYYSLKSNEQLGGNGHSIVFINFPKSLHRNSNKEKYFNKLGM